MEAAGLLLAGPKANLRAKLTEKSRTRPAAMMRQRMPAGASALSKVPKLGDVARASAGGPGKKISQATAVAAYEKEVRETTKVFQRSHMTEATLEEHDKYTIWISKWAELSGFGAYVTVNKKVRLHPRRRKHWRLMGWRRCWMCGNCAGGGQSAS